MVPRDHFGREAAAAELDASYVRYDCTLDEMQEAKKRFRPGLSLPDPFRSLVHEQTHLQHAYGTPVGMFLRRIQQLQEQCVLHLLQLLTEHKIPVRGPLIRWLSTQDERVKRLTMPARRLWNLAELLRVAQIGSIDAWESGVIRNEFSSAISPEAALEYVLEIMERTESESFDTAGTESLTNRTHQSSWNHLYDFKKDAGMTAGLRTVMRGQINMAAVLETTAYITEFYGCGSEELAGAHEPLVGSLEYSTYNFLLILSPAHRLDEAPPHQQILTRRAAAELSLFVPVLHELSHHRTALRVQDLLPLSRYIRMWELLKDVRPVTDLADVTRYYDDACERTGWTHPSEVCTDTLRLLSVDDSDRRCLAFATGLGARIVDPGFFINPFASLLGHSHFGNNVAKLFDFATMEFADGRMLLDKDRSRATWFKLEYLWGRWIRGMMISPRPVLGIPWECDQYERDYLTYELRKRIGNLLGRNVPSPLLQGREGSAHGE
ncbi:Uncharacterised protein [Kocuria rosea]|nr:Uncharacterised protein [Kocuria rosea]